MVEAESGSVFIPIYLHMYIHTVCCVCSTEVGRSTGSGLAAIPIRLHTLLTVTGGVLGIGIIGAADQKEGVFSTGVLAP